jgi:chromosome partitioning protein
MYATRSFQQRLPNGTDRIIVDTPSAVTTKELDVLLRGCHVILIPVLPSGFDMRAAERFVEQLHHHRLYKARPVPVATIANRVRPKTQGQSRLHEFLERLGIHNVATFRDKAVYARLAEQGRGIFDVPDEREAASEVEQWEALIEWINHVGTKRTSQPSGPASAARAGRHSSERTRQPA